MGKTMMVGGHPLTFRFDVSAWLEIEEKFGSLDAMGQKMQTGDKPLTTNMEMMVILANCQERYLHKERARCLTMEELQESLSPKQVREAIRQAKAAVKVGMIRKNADDEDEDVDVVADELAKKAEATLRPGSASPSA